ncbi:hypothetical protein AN477_08095 [Alicyclobacillus ferrooxydans]|uniref:SAM-dependent MTase RsmB/NOP-type domain-containing protein n=2 Tax=Alicyclobacillus ferrooxydans TaxID=471514 RepID=A0A0P9GT47_9BACL|nr:hypothetical protein AN477_08095 [Alicyclobacillus ferrooxydans]
MEYLLGDEWRSLRTAMETKPALRGLRLHRWTIEDDSQFANPAANLPDVPAVVNHLRSDDLYAIAHPALLPHFIKEQLGKPVPWMDDGFYIDVDSNLGKTIYHDAGAFYIQEPSAMAVASAVQARPGERVLDLCAAPGGKTTALARSLRGQGVLVANEIHPVRVTILAQNLERLGVPAVVVNESPERLAHAWPEYFDVVLVDAPCSGEGMFRKDDTARAEWTPDAPKVCALRQRDILRNAVQLVRPGGRLVYSTCTLNPIENEQVAAWAVQEFGLILQPLPDWPGWSSGRPEWADDNPDVALTRRLWPHLGEGEGHFVAAFRVPNQIELNPSTGLGAVQDVKPSNFDGGRRALVMDRRARGNRENGPSKKGRSAGNDQAVTMWYGLMDDLFTDHPAAWNTPVIRKGLLFEPAPPDLDTTGLKVLRTGVCLAELIGQRLGPHHSLAMAVNPGILRKRVELSADEATAYMAGNTLDRPTESGWNWLSTAGSIPVGWGKGVPGRVNNAYPRGLRRSGLLT